MSRIPPCFCIQGLPRINRCWSSFVIRNGANNLMCPCTVNVGQIAWVISGTGLPLNSFIGLGLANWIKKICGISHTWCVIAKSMKAILIAPVYNKKMVLISFILPRLHATIRALLVNKMLGRLDVEINNSFSPPTATVVGVRCFPS